MTHADLSGLQRGADRRKIREECRRRGLAGCPIGFGFRRAFDVELVHTVKVNLLRGGKGRYRPTIDGLNSARAIRLRYTRKKLT